MKSSINLQVLVARDDEATAFVVVKKIEERQNIRERRSNRRRRRNLKGAANAMAPFGGSSALELGVVFRFKKSLKTR